MITAVLLNWKRPDNWKKILPNLLACDLIDEILIWDNSGTLVLPKLPRVVVVRSEQNFGTFPRYHLAQMAKNETIYFQDDDLEVSARTIEALYKKLTASRNTGGASHLGLFPRDLIDGNYVVSVAQRDGGQCDILAGRCTMFDRSIVPEFFKFLNRRAILKQIDWVRNLGMNPTYADDIIFSYACHYCTSLRPMAFKLAYSELPAPEGLCDDPRHYEMRKNMAAICQRIIK